MLHLWYILWIHEGVLKVQDAILPHSVLKLSKSLLSVKGKLSAQLIIL